MKRRQHAPQRRAGHGRAGWQNVRRAEPSGARAELATAGPVRHAADRRLAAPRQLPRRAAPVGRAAGRPRRVLLRRRPARDHGRARPREAAPAHPGDRGAVPRRRRRPRRSARCSCSRHVPAHTQLRVGPRLHHRLRRGQPDDAVQGQVRPRRAATRPASGCSPTRSCRRPTSCSTRPTGCRSARTSASTSSSRRDLAAAVQHALRRRRSRCPSRTSSRTTAKIYDLQQVEKQMSKSIGGSGCVWLLDDPKRHREEDPQRGHRHRPRGRRRPGGQAGRHQPADHPVGAFTGEDVPALEERMAGQRLRRPQEGGRRGGPRRSRCPFAAARPRLPRRPGRAGRAARARRRQGPRGRRARRSRRPTTGSGSCRPPVRTR